MRSDTERFVELFDAYSARVNAYVRRHCEWSVVDDVVSETFLVAWRRLDRIPDEPLPWLLVVARNTLANERRTFARHDRARQEIAVLELLVSTDRAIDDMVIGRATMLLALASLSSRAIETAGQVADFPIPVLLKETS